VTPWKALAASGFVQARPAAAADAPWRAVGRGDELTPQTLVETGRKGRVTLTRSASLLVIDPDSRVELPEEGYGDLETSVVQTRGSVLYEVDSRSAPHFEVVTPYLVAGVKGTEFLVTVNDRYAAVLVRHGRVEITRPDSDETLSLGPGESLVRHREDAEVDLVRDVRRSREARTEAKRLERLDRWKDEKLADPNVKTDVATDVKESDEAFPALSIKEMREDEKSSWTDDTVDAKQVEDSTKPLIEDDITKGLIEEMIREETNEGTIDATKDDVVALPPDPAQQSN